MNQAMQILVDFFFNDTATTEIYTLSLHDALPISSSSRTGLQSCDSHPETDGFHPRRRARRSSIARCNAVPIAATRSEEHTSELQSQSNLVCRLLLEKQQETVS